MAGRHISFSDAHWQALMSLGRQRREAVPVEQYLNAQTPEYTKPQWEYLP